MNQYPRQLTIVVLSCRTSHQILQGGMFRAPFRVPFRPVMIWYPAIFVSFFIFYFRRSGKIRSFVLFASREWILFEPITWNAHIVLWTGDSGWRVVRQMIQSREEKLKTPLYVSVCIENISHSQYDLVCWTTDIHEQNVPWTNFNDLYTSKVQNM